MAIVHLFRKLWLLVVYLYITNPKISRIGFMSKTALFHCSSPRNSSKDVVLDVGPDPCRLQPPFWYKGGQCLQEANWPVGDPDDYRYTTLPYPLPSKTLLEEMEIERPERYLPGEIYKNQRPKEPVEDLSKTANCSKIWTPKDPGFYCEFQPTTEMLNPPSLLSGVLQRKAETINSYDRPTNPQATKLSQCCECVEDLETKTAKRCNHLDGLSFTNTRPEDFTCPPDTDVKFENACKIADTTYKISPKLLQKFQKCNNVASIPESLRKKVNFDCKCKKIN